MTRGLGLAISHPRPWHTDTLGRCFRVVDAEGSAVLLVGDVREPGVRELGERIADLGERIARAGRELTELWKGDAA